MSGCGCCKELEMNILYHNEELPRVHKIEQGDWLDLRAAVTVEMKQFDFKYINLGLSVDVPEGYELWIAPRSSTFKTWGILQPNSPGIVDNSYSGDGDILHMPALAMRDTKIEFGDRICQIRLMPVQKDLVLNEVDTLGNDDRGGLGSTGKN